jgi:tRNA modification GTPase
MSAHTDRYPNAMLDDTTIVAIATAAGRGGIGVVRLSGRDAVSIAAKLFPREVVPGPRVAHYCILRDSSGARVDDAIMTYFSAPHSYTGEDVVEIATHGSPVVLDWLLRAALQQGAVQARPGEFTERAFLSGRMDLVQAEAVRDLIDAQTVEQARQAAEQMGGSVAAAVRPIKERLVALIAALEAGIDFAEDDIDTMPPEQIAASIAPLLAPLESLLASFAHGRLLREGLRLAIVGKPNAGKSSLFNCLVERERAIVTATPGTTRDVIAEHISLDGIPVELLDTAGLRETDDEAERMGVQRSHEAMAEADAVLLVADASEQQADGDLTDDATMQVAAGNSYELLRNRPVIVVWNKVDLLPAPDVATPTAIGAVTSASEALRDTSAMRDSRETVEQASTEHWRIVRTSTVTGEGVATLREAIVALATGVAAAGGGATLTNLRHHDAVARAHTDLLRAQNATRVATPHEMLLLDLYGALRALDELTGQTTADDILHRIFSTFCIGK